MGGERRGHGIQPMSRAHEVRHVAGRVAGKAAPTFDLLYFLIAFHPFYRGTTCASPGEFRLVTENAIRGNRHYVKLQRLYGTGVFSENLWVDPSRGDVVVFFERMLRGRPVRTHAFQYEHDPKQGWLPVAWFFPPDDTKRAEWTNEAAVINSTINEKFPPGTFAPKFPPGTTVFDETTNEAYRVAADGSKSGLLKFDSPAALRIYQALETTGDFTLVPGPLKDALNFLGARFNIEIVIDQNAADVTAIDLSAEASTKIKGLKVREMLDLWLKQCGKPIGYRIRKGVLVIEPPSSAK
jgi:hypothetical protein